MPPELVCFVLRSKSIPGGVKKINIFFVHTACLCFFSICCMSFSRFEFVSEPDRQPISQPVSSILQRQPIGPRWDIILSLRVFISLDIYVYIYIRHFYVCAMVYEYIYISNGDSVHFVELYLSFFPIPIIITIAITIATTSTDPPPLRRMFYFLRRTPGCPSAIFRRECTETPCGGQRRGVLRCCTLRLPLHLRPRGE